MPPNNTNKDYFFYMQHKTADISGYIFDSQLILHQLKKAQWTDHKQSRNGKHETNKGEIQERTMLDTVHTFGDFPVIETDPIST